MNFKEYWNAMKGLISLNEALSKFNDYNKDVKIAHVETSTLTSATVCETVIGYFGNPDKKTEFKLNIV